ncbi:MAG: type II secretion system GspH family protein [Deltaproteobacteria bacterium]|nr:type II secretion system GspH family protein [Deltaproteobacteria bacterium]
MSDNNPSSSPRPAGFTLLELIIALSLLGIVLTLIYGSLAQLSTGAVGLREGLNERQELRLLLKMISDDLRAMRWLTYYVARHPDAPAGLRATLHKEGNGEFSELSMHCSQSARFFRALPREKDPGLHEVGWKVRPGAEGLLELFRREDFYLDEDMLSGGVEVPVAENIQTFKVEFLPISDAPTTFEEWRSQWNSMDQPRGKRLPLAMRLKLGRKLPSGEVLEETMEFNQYVRD